MSAITGNWKTPHEGKNVFICGDCSGGPMDLGRIVQSIQACDFALVWSDKEEIDAGQASEAAMAMSRGVPVVFAGYANPGSHSITLAYACDVFLRGASSVQSAIRLGSIVEAHRQPGCRIGIMWTYQLESFVDACESPPELRLAVSLAARSPEIFGTITAQQEIAAGGSRYRADFTVVGEADEFSKEVKVVVEVDGHDYHERTKEQASRDKSRDRAMTLAGWQVLRFTGSEVWKNADGCARQVSDLTERLAGLE